MQAHILGSERLQQKKLHMIDLLHDDGAMQYSGIEINTALKSADIAQMPFVIFIEAIVSCICLYIYHLYMILYCICIIGGTQWSAIEDCSFIVIFIGAIESRIILLCTPVQLHFTI